MKDIVFIIALMASLLLSLLQAFIINTDDNKMASTIINPIDQEIVSFGKEFKLNLDYAHKIKYGSTLNPEKFELINNTDDDYDVIIIGDSSVYMGLSHAVLKQYTHQKVGIFSFPALHISQPLIGFIDLLKQHKLKKQGLLILMFNHIFWLKDYYSQQENQQIDRLINKPNIFIEPNDCFFCKQHQNLYFDNFTRSLKHFFIFGNNLSLPYLNFYHPLIEEFIAPTAYKRKKLNAKEVRKGARFLIEDNIVFIHQTKPFVITKKTPLPTQAVLLNPNLGLKKNDFFNRKIQFGFVIPLTTDDLIRQELNRVYDSYFSDMPLVDMNGLLPQNWAVDAQNRTHMSNLGSFKQSILLATWINRYMTEKGTNLNRVIE